MPKWNDLDLGASHAWPQPRTGMAFGSSLVKNSRTRITKQGGRIVEFPVEFLARAWQSIGGETMTFNAARWLAAQIEEMSRNPDMNPIYFQNLATAESGAYTAIDPHDGWYLADPCETDYKNNVVTGQILVSAMLSRQRPGIIPASLGLAYTTGSDPLATYSATATPLLAFPLGATGLPGTTGTRTGAEGATPVATVGLTGGPNPAYFVPVLSSLWGGACRVFDTMSPGGNAVPAPPGTYHANWVEVYAPDHRFIGDVIVTNGLHLYRFQPGNAGFPLVYLWDLSLSTVGWNALGYIQYQDNAGNNGTLRSVELQRVGRQIVHLKARANTSGGKWSEIELVLTAGAYGTRECRFKPLSEANTNANALAWILNTAYVTGFTESTTQTTFPSSLATTATNGYGAAQGSASGSPVFGWFYQTTPAVQGRLQSNTAFGFGNSGGPSQEKSQLFGFFAVPYSGAVVLATARALVAPLYTQFKAPVTQEWVGG